MEEAVVLPGVLPVVLPGVLPGVLPVVLPGVLVAVDPSVAGGLPVPGTTSPTGKVVQFKQTREKRIGRKYV